MLLGKEKNVIHQGKHPTGIKNAAFSREVSVAALEKKAYELGISQGQLLMKLLSQSLSQYMTRCGTLKTKQIRIAIQCLIRRSFTGQLRDNLSMRITSLSLDDSPSISNESVSEAHGIHFLSKCVGFLPAIVSKIISLSLSKKVTLVY